MTESHTRLGEDRPAGSNCKDVSDVPEMVRLEEPPAAPGNAKETYNSRCSCCLRRDGTFGSLQLDIVRVRPYGRQSTSHQRASGTGLDVVTGSWRTGSLLQLPTLY